jgi:phytanoyl-CoA hydroxylase
MPIGGVGVKGCGLIYLDRAHDIGARYEEEFSKMNAEPPDEDR